MSIHQLTPLVAGRLTVAAYHGFRPIAWSDNGVPAGRDIAFLRAFAAQQQLELVVRFAPFEQLWALPGRDWCDVAASGIAPLPERESPGMVWSAPYFQVQRALLIRAADQSRLRTIADMAGRTIAVTRGSTAEADARRRAPATAQVVICEDQQSALDALVAGTIDAYGTGDASCDYLVSTFPGRFAVADRHPYDPPETFAFALRAPSGVRQPLDRFIAEHRHRY